MDGVAVPPNPTGGFTPADVTINTLDPVIIEIEATDVPVDTTVSVDIHSQTEGTQTVDSTPLTGIADPLTSTATATIPSGFSSVTLRASFDPNAP